MSKGPEFKVELTEEQLKSIVIENIKKKEKEADLKYHQQRMLLITVGLIGILLFIFL